MRKILFFLFVVSLSVKAEEKVYYCEMTDVAKITIDGGEFYAPEKFRFKVSYKKNIVFGSGGIMNNAEVPISFWGGFDMFQASSNGAHLFFNKPALHVVWGNFDVAMAFSARCDDF
ncbi:hypothetical protein OA099_03475 [Litorivicinus sp.]|nr:hypothetical protein [Litorivicinus sp.]